MTWPLIPLAQRPDTIAGMPPWAVARLGTVQHMADALILWVSCHEDADREVVFTGKLHEWHDAWADFAGVADARRKTQLVARLFAARWDEIFFTGGAVTADAQVDDRPPPTQPAEDTPLPPDPIRYVLFDRALPLSPSAAAGKDRHDMSMPELLAALLITALEEQDNPAAIALVRQAMAPPDRAEVAA